jgi:hypothetical protein
MKVPSRRVTTLNGDPLGRFILDCFVIQDQENRSRVDKAVEILEQELFEPTPKNEYVVVLTIDGVEIDLEAVVNYWNEHQERTLNYRALELFKEKTDSIQNQMHETVSAVQEQFNGLKMCVAEQFGTSYDPYDDTFN